MSKVKNWATTVAAGVALPLAQSCSPNQPAPSANQPAQRAVQEPNSSPAQHNQVTVPISDDMRKAVDRAVTEIVGIYNNPLEGGGDFNTQKHAMDIKIETVIKPLLKKAKDSPSDHQGVIEYIISTQASDLQRSIDIELSASNKQGISGEEWEQTKKEVHNLRQRATVYGMLGTAFLRLKLEAISPPR